MKKGIILTVIIGLFLLNLISAQTDLNDFDFDTYNLSVDCNDNDSLVWKNMTLYLDYDNDGYGGINSSIFCIGETIPVGYSDLTGDCNDNNNMIYPDATEIINNAIDENCDGFDSIDYDFDSFFRFNKNTTLKDCDDTNPFIYPFAKETCNNIDDDCDNKIDEDFINKGETCYVGTGECKNVGVYICNENQNATRCKAVAKEPKLEVCDNKDNDCDNLIDEEGVCDSDMINISFNDPLNSIYGYNNIPVNISVYSSKNLMPKYIGYTDYSNSIIKQNILCKNCFEYGKFTKKLVNLKDGYHNISFFSIINETKFENYSYFLIDSKKPRLYLPRIRTKEFLNGTFLINYDETNIQNITLFYLNNSITKEDCKSGNNQICSIYLNMSFYEGKDILYSFLLKDKAGNTISSKNITGEIDITPPKIESINYPVIGNYVYFRFNITEKNFEDVSYYDNSVDNPKWKKLCTVLKNNICEKQQRLSPGEHNITIRVLDKAKNAVYESI